MKSKKNSREDKNLPVHNKTHKHNKKQGLFRGRKKAEKEEKLTVEQEILRMRAAERKKREKNEARGKSAARGEIKIPLKAENEKEIKKKEVRKRNKSFI